MSLWPAADHQKMLTCHRLYQKLSLVILIDFKCYSQFPPVFSSAADGVGARIVLGNTTAGSVVGHHTLVMFCLILNYTEIH